MILLSKQSGAKLRWIISTTTFYWLKIIGLAPFSHRIWKSSGYNSRHGYWARSFYFSKTGLAHNVLVLIAVQLTTALAWPNLRQYFSSKTLMVSFISTLPLILHYLTANFVLVYWTIRQKTAVSIMNRLVEVDRLLSGIEDQSSTTVHALFSLVVIFSGTLWTYQFLAPALIYPFFQIVSLLLTKGYSFFLYWFVVEYSLVVGHVARELERVNRSFLNHVEVVSHKSGPPAPSPLSRLQSLKLLFEIRTTLYEASRDVAEFFSLPILTSVASFTYAFLINVFSFGKSMLVENKCNDLVVCFGYLTSVLVVVHPLTWLSLNVTRAANEAKLTRRIVHKLAAAATSEEIRTELQDFALQLLHEDAVYTAHGLFMLDCTMLISILDTTMTYMVLLFGA